MAEVVVDEVEFGVVVLRGPLEGLGDVAGFRYVPERSVGIRRADVAGGTEDFADVFREVVAVGEPRAVFLNRERTRRRRLSRIPGDEPQSGMCRARQIERCDLQVPAIDVAVVQRRRSRNRHFLFKTATLGIVSAFDDGLRFRVLKTCRTIFTVVGDAPRSRGGLNRSHVPVCVTTRIEHEKHRTYGAISPYVSRGKAFTKNPSSHYR